MYNEYFAPKTDVIIGLSYLVETIKTNKDIERNIVLIKCSLIIPVYKFSNSEVKEKTTHSPNHLARDILYSPAQYFVFKKAPNEK